MFLLIHHQTNICMEIYDVMMNVSFKQRLYANVVVKSINAFKYCHI